MLETRRPVVPPLGDGCAGRCRATTLFPFTMAFQPIVDLRERRIDSYEALVRGPGGEGAGFVLSQVTEKTLYAFDQACRVRAIELAAALGLRRRLSINFLPNAVYEPRACIQATLDAAARTGFPRELLTFEILESETVADTRHLRAIITEYRRHGFEVALDDFATGHSGLLRLADLRPDSVKVDRALVMGCHEDRTRLAILGGIVRICEDVGIKVVMEGVELEAELLALRSIGARFAQGFLFSRPLLEGLATDADIRWNSGEVVAAAAI